MQWEDLDEEQKTAVKACLDTRNRAVGVEGPPGSGKTTINKFVYEGLTKLGWEVAACAVPGRAARRYTEATGYAAQTVHKLLEYSKPGDLDEHGRPMYPGVPMRHARRRLTQRAIIIDEASMLTQELWMNIKNALPSGGIVRMFGDRAQLPPIEYGASGESAFSRCLGFNSIELTQYHRQGEGSGIISNAIRIRKGLFVHEHDDFHLKATNQQAVVLRGMIIKDEGYRGFDKQVITPMKKGKNGSTAYNEMIQKVYQGDSKEGYQFAHIKLYPRDKVIMTKNYYALGDDGVMNGDVGIVTKIDPTIPSVTVDFGYDKIEIPETIYTDGPRGRVITHPINDLDLAYAITTHKSIGSEYDETIVVLDRGHRFVLYRNNFYTAVTRAKKSTHLLYDPGCVRMALSEELPTFKARRDDN